MDWGWNTGTSGRGPRGLRALAGLVLLATVVVHGSAAAQGAQAGDSPEYRKLIEDGLQEFDHGNWEEATALFEQAHAVNPNARTLRALGLCAFEARRYTEALKYLNAAITDKRRPLTAQQRSELQRSIDRAEHYVGGLKLIIDPPEAALRIDGQAIARDGDKELVVNSGVLEIEVTAPNYQTELRRVRVASQGHEELSIKLVPTAAEVAAPEPAAAPQPSGTPATPADVETHTSALHTWKWVTGGAAVAALAVGVTMHVLANTEADKWNACLDAKDTGCSSHNDRSKTYRTVDIVSFSAGAALGVLTVVFFVLDGQSSTAASAARTCQPGPGDLGIHCHLAF